MNTTTDYFQTALTNATAHYSAPMTGADIADSAKGMARIARHIQTLMDSAGEYSRLGNRDAALMTAIREMEARGVGDLDWTAEGYFLCSQAVSMVVTEWVESL